MSWVLRSVLFALAFTSAAEGQYCSLTVRVLSPDGRQPAAPVEVTEKSGHTQTKDQGLDGDVQFCDLGGLPVTVKVGDDGTCNQVIVRDVPVEWNKPYFLHVTYDPEACEERPALPMPICRIVFRISAGEKWEDRARILITRPSTEMLSTDRFGRASLVINLGSEIEGTVARGTDTRTFGFRCTRNEPVHEVRIDFPSK